MSILVSLLLVQAATTPTALPKTVPPQQRRIVCKTIMGTGSRLNSQRLCMSKYEWQRMHEQGRKMTGDMQDSYSKMPPQGQ